MNKYQKLGVLLIVLTWLVAGLTFFGVMPNYSGLSWLQGLGVSIGITIIGITLYFGTKEEKEPITIGDEENGNEKK